jgi:hypothetical protein
MNENSEIASGRSPALETLASQLNLLYLNAGRPSLRSIAKALKNAVDGNGERPPSHTSVGVVLHCAHLPRWRYLELIVRHLGKLRSRPTADIDADVARFRDLWVAAAGPVVVRQESGPDETEETFSGGLQAPHKPEDLNLNCVLPLALDDQWMPRHLLWRMAVEGASADEVEQDRQRLIQGEFIRSLVTAKRVVINRAFLFRNEVISRSYTKDSESGEAFAELLRQQAVFIFLIDERDPLECGYAKEPSARASARAWAEIAGSVQVSCVRFDWEDEEENKRQANAWHGDFDRRIRLTATINRDRLLEDVGAGGGDADVLGNQLDGLSRRAMPRKRVRITRTQLYEEFVVRDPADVAPRRYDFAKPNMIALKWLFDLVYNSNLATRLGVALAGPVDSVHRSMVHSPSFFQDEPGETRLDVARVRSAVMETIQDALFRRGYGVGALSVFDGVTLPDVVRIREGEPWKRYARAVDTLLAEPWLLAHPERGLREVLQRYDDMISAIGGHA